MKNLIKNTAVILLVLGSANNAFAHEASKHKENATKPKCEAMSNMDMSSMDVDDPIMQAMMKRCESSGENHDVSNENLSEKKVAACTEEHAEMGHCKMKDEKQIEKSEHEND